MKLLQGAVGKFKKIYKSMKKSFKKYPIPVTFAIIVIASVIIFWIESLYKVDVNTRIISLTALFATVGYFLTHFLEIERRKKEMRINHYIKLSKGIRVFIKGAKTPEEKKSIEDFEKTYYSSWLTVSSDVYEKLKIYLASYAELTKDDESKKDADKKKNYNTNLESLMRAMREEFVSDDYVEFKVYDMQPKEE